MENFQSVENFKEFYPVKLIMALTFSSEEVLASALENLQSNYKEIEARTPVFVFDHTHYYKEEMGANLRKQFMSFRELTSREELIRIKLHTIDLEKISSKEGKRQVNIDPAYLELAKLVVASTKNFSHRILLGNGIYGDVQMMYRQGKFVFNEWTYPDYQSETVTGFLLRARATYYDQLKGLG